MRVLHVVNYGWPWIDGYTIRTAGMLTAQVRDLGWTVRVVPSGFAPFARARDERFTTPGWGPEVQRQRGTQARSWERPGVGLAPVTRRDLLAVLAEEIAGFRPDAVHAHHPHYVGRVGVGAARAAGVPAVYEVRCFNGDYDADRRNPYARGRGAWFNHLEMQVARQADAVVTISDGLARRLVAGGVPPRRVRVVRNSVDTGRFSPAAAHEVDRLHVGYATTFEAIENLDLLVEGTARAVERGARLRVTIAGTGRDWDRVRALVRARGMDEVIALPGFVPYVDMPALYADLDLFVVVRHAATVAHDTTPLKPLEALASGVPVLATDLPALRELLADRDGARLFRPDPDVLADLLVEAAEDPPLRVTADIDDRSWSREVTRYRDVYAAAGVGVPA